MRASVTLLDVVEKYPRTQKQRRQQRSRKPGIFICMRLRERSLILCIASDGDSNGGIDWAVCT